MKNLKALLITVFSLCSIAASQNIEHQIVASQYGAYQVPTVGQGFSFPPASCQIAAGGKNFPAFAASVPIKVVDTNPAQIEIDTPVAVNVNNNNCSVSMSTTYNHISFYLTSGTGGLQEALNAGQVTGGANTVILDQQWYSQVVPGNPATVISSVKGTTALGLVDVTTTPYTYYSWNGSAYAQTTSGGGTTTHAITFDASGSGASPGTSFNGTAAQTISTNTIGAAPINSPTFTGSPKAPTQAVSDNNTEIATTQAVTTALVPYATLASPAFTGTVTAPTVSVTTNNTQVATTSAVSSALLTYAPLANPAFTGVPTVPTAAPGTNTSQAASTAFVLANGSAGNLPNATAAGQAPVSTGAGIAYSAQYTGNVNGQVQYVTTSGNNSHTGASWQAAKLTIAAAVAALPVSGTLGSGGHHYGTIYIGPGNFPENGNLELNQSIAYIGTQAGLLGSSGTTVSLVNGANNPLFSYTSDWPAALTYSHDITLENLDLNGNNANNSAGNLVNIFYGGYNTKIDNVSFQFAAGYGLYINGKAVNFACYSCTFGADAGGAIYVNETGAGSAAVFTDTQLDNDGTTAITIAQGTFNTASTFTFINLKAESSVSGQHNHVIEHTSGSNFITGDQITVIGAYGYCAASTCDSYIYDAPGTGSEARWKIQNLSCGEGYTSCFHSAKSGDTFDDTIVINDYSSNDRTTAGMTQTSPDFGVSGGSGIWGYPGNPTGAVPSNPGSLSLDYVNGETWQKVAGAGTAGWAPLAIVPPVFTHVQDQNSCFTNVCAFPSNVASGNLLVTRIESTYSGSQLVPTDTLGNTYRCVNTTSIFNTFYHQDCYTITTSSGANTIATGGTSGAMAVAEFHRSAGAWVLDQNVLQQQTSVTSQSSGNVTTTATPEMLVGFFDSGGGTPTWTAGAGWTSFANTSNYILGEYNLAFYAGVVAATASTSISTTSASGILTFK